MVPVLGWSSPTARCNSVDFPAPFGPTRPATFPVGIDNVHPISARWRP
jgi:hypothetical protein